MIFSQTHLLFIYISSSNVLLFWLLLCYNLLLPSLAKLWINTIRYVWFWQILLKLWIRSVKLNKSQGQDEWADRNNDLLWAFRYLLCSFAILVHQDVMDNDPIKSNLSDCHHSTLIAIVTVSWSRCTVDRMGWTLSEYWKLIIYIGSAVSMFKCWLLHERLDPFHIHQIQIHIVEFCAVVFITQDMFSCHASST